MNHLLTFLVLFIAVGFFYIHINYHLKTSNDLEVYQIDNPSTVILEEVCALRQPFIFYMPGIAFDINRLSQAETLDIIVRCGNNFQIIPLTALGDGQFSENNRQLMADIDLEESISKTDAMLRPPMVIRCLYDLVVGKNCNTPMRYYLDYRSYIRVVQGGLTLKLTPPKNVKHLTLVKDYDMFEFRVDEDPWTESACWDRARLIDVRLGINQAIFVPAYWLHSMQFQDYTIAVVYRYSTVMSEVSIANERVMQMLQNNNTKYRLDQYAPTCTNASGRASDALDAAPAEAEAAKAELAASEAEAAKAEAEAAKAESAAAASEAEAAKAGAEAKREVEAKRESEASARISAVAVATVSELDAGASEAQNQ